MWESPISRTFTNKKDGMGLASVLLIIISRVPLRLIKETVFDYDYLLSLIP